MSKDKVLYIYGNAAAVEKFIYTKCKKSRQLQHKSRNMYVGTTDRNVFSIPVAVRGFAPQCLE